MLPAAEVQAVLGRAEATRVTALLHNQNQRVTTGIWRVEAGGRSAVLKILSGYGAAAEPTHWQPSSDPTHWNWWRREAEVHRSGLVDLAYGGSGVRAPELRACFERADGSLALWTEDVTGDAWTVDGAGPAAAAWGLAQGGAAARDALSVPWTSRRFLRTYCATMPVRSELRDPSQWSSPLVRWVPGPVRDGLARLHDERDWFFSIMERLPRTLCHLDVWPANLFAQVDGSMVAVDWAFVGDGAVGEDMGNLIADSIFDGHLPSSCLPSLEGAVVDGYLAGLHEAGWEGDERCVRLAVCASAVKYHWLAAHMLWRAQQDAHTAYGGIALADTAHQYRERFTVLTHLLGWATEARRLADRLGLA